jgi:hypothetical protein
VLLTRLPLTVSSFPLASSSSNISAFPALRKLPARFGPFDLHVLGTPPAFILSQDQTLRKILTHTDRSVHQRLLRVAQALEPSHHSSVVKAPGNKKTAGHSAAGRPSSALAVTRTGASTKPSDLLPARLSQRRLARVSPHQHTLLYHTVVRLSNGLFQPARAAGSRPQRGNVGEYTQAHAFCQTAKRGTSTPAE